MNNKTPYPNYEDTMSEAKQTADNSGVFGKYEEIGYSGEGRPIPLLTITDPAIDSSQKSVVIFTGGTDGHEETGRASTLALAKTLLQPENAAHLQKQVVLIIPTTNPDGAVLNIGPTANGISLNSSYPHDAKPLTCEAETIQELIKAWIPDAYFDVHGLAGGSMGDGVYLYPTVNHRWSTRVLSEIGIELDQVAEQAGFPQGHPHLWLENVPSLNKWVARNQSGFSMLLESTERYYPLEDSVKSMLPRLMHLIKVGEQTKFFQTIPNYPCDVVSGNPICALMPFGDDYTSRRKCRRDMAQMIIEGVPWFGREAADPDWTATLTLPVEDSVKTLPSGLVFQATLDRRATISKVLWQDHLLEDSLWSSWDNGIGIVVRVEIPEPPIKGDNVVKIKYEAPFKRHTTI